MILQDLNEEQIQPVLDTEGAVLVLTACGGAEDEAGRLLADALTEAADELLSPEDNTNEDAAGWAPEYGGYYYDVENVVLYLVAYGELPPNYITKDEARDLGWQGGSVEDYLDGAAIGGDRFGNYEGQLPEAKGRTYTECDIDTDGYGSRGSRRLVFSNDGLFFYTHDHYEHFDEVYVTEDYEVIW